MTFGVVHGELLIVELITNYAVHTVSIPDMVADGFVADSRQVMLDYLVLVGGDLA
jgi:hypothetical protein